MNSQPALDLIAPVALASASRHNREPTGAQQSHVVEMAVIEGRASTT